MMLHCWQKACSIAVPLILIVVGMFVAWIGWAIPEPTLAFVGMGAVLFGIGILGERS